MLEELKNLDFLCNKEDILYFLQSVVGSKSLTIDDIRIICAHSPGRYQLAIDALIIYCCCFNWIKYDSYVHLDEKMLKYINSKEEMNDELVYRTVEILFACDVFKPELFFYNFIKEKFIFKNELFPLYYSSVRNVLISQTFFEVEKSLHNAVFYINERYETLISKYCKEKNITLTLKQLEKKLESNARAGEQAESFVLEYEKARLSGSFLLKKIRIISDIDVCAGYDIVSFDTIDSFTYDRFIEVKAVSMNKGFYWSSNELNVAKIKGSQYYLYLVDLGKIKSDKYTPLIIKNPAINIMSSLDWLIEPETYYIQHI